MSKRRGMRPALREAVTMPQPASFSARASPSHGANAPGAGKLPTRSAERASGERFERSPVSAPAREVSIDAEEPGAKFSKAVLIDRSLPPTFPHAAPQLRGAGEEDHALGQLLRSSGDDETRFSLLHDGRGIACRSGDD